MTQDRLDPREQPDPQDQLDQLDRQGSRVSLGGREIQVPPDGQDQREPMERHKQDPRDPLDSSRV